MPYCRLAAGTPARGGTDRIDNKEITMGKKLTDKMGVRVDQHGVKHEIVVEFDFTGVTEGQVNELLLAALRVKFAARARKQGEKALQEMAQNDVNEVMVTDLFERAPAGPVDVFNVAAKMDKDKLQALIAQLEAQLKG